MESFKSWLAEGSGTSLLYVCHANYVAERGSPEDVQRYETYLRNTVAKFQGPVVLTLMYRQPDIRPEENPEKHMAHFQLMRAIKGLGSDRVQVLYEKYAGDTVGTQQFGDIVARSSPSRFYVAGGYLDMCLRATIGQLKAKYPQVPIVLLPAFTFAYRDLHPSEMPDQQISNPKSLGRFAMANLGH